MTKRLFKISKFLLIFLLITGWIFSGWPQIWQNPRVPPQINIVHADTSTVYSTAATSTFAVPAGVTTITVKAWGAGAGGGGGGDNAPTAPGGAGGGGGFIIGTISVTPEESLTVTVGDNGSGGTGDVTNGGGGGGGGGYSAVKRGETFLFIAGGGAGGGGGDDTTNGTGGAGGAGGGQIGINGTVSGTANPGLGGTQTAGGAGGSGINGTGANGASLTGGAGGGGTEVGAGGAGGANGGGKGGSGNSNGSDSGGGGGGGAGYFGGGGGGADSGTDGAAGGGGGSSFAISTATATSTSFGSGTAAGNNIDSDYASPAGGGGAGGLAGSGNGSPGNDGRVVITYYSTFNQSGYRFFANTDTTDVGTPLAALNATSTLGSTGVAFRLRMLLHVGTSNLAINGQAFKLLFAGAGANGNCASPGGTPSWYTDVTSTTTIAYKNNTPADGDTLTANADDPTHGADTIVNQTYEELNNFTNSVAAIPATQDGKWDFALVDNGAPASTAYCFRAVKTDYTVLDTYTVYPAVITAAAASLTLTVDTSSVFIGTNTPGTPVASSSVLTVNTNNSTGYNITINRASTTPTLFLTGEVSITIPDTPNGNNWTAPTATSTVGPSAVWTVGATNGLGFRVMQTGTVSNTYSSTWWGTDDTSGNAKYSGISTSTAAQIIANTTLGSGSNENTTVEYKLDTATTQKSGSYESSPIIFTATTN